MKLTIIRAAALILTINVSQLDAQENSLSGSNESLISEAAEQVAGPQEHVLVSRDSSGTMHTRVIVRPDRIDLLDDDGKEKRRILREDDPNKKIHTTFISPEGHASLLLRQNIDESIRGANA